MRSSISISLLLSGLAWSSTSASAIAPMSRSEPALQRRAPEAVPITDATITLIASNGQMLEPDHIRISNQSDCAGNFVGTLNDNGQWTYTGVKIIGLDLPQGTYGAVCFLEPIDGNGNQKWESYHKAGTYTFPTPMKVNRIIS